MGLLDRLRGGLARTREVLETPVEDLVRGRRPLDAAALESVEEALIAADLGLPAVARGDGGAARQERRDRARRPARDARSCCAPSCGGRSSGRQRSRPSPSGPGSCSWSASTARARPPRSASWRPPGPAEGRSVLLCAADTFRAAAAEQLEVWAGRTGRGLPSRRRGRRSRRRPDRRAAHGARARHGRRAGRHGRPAAHQGQPDGGAREDGARRRARGARRAARDAAGARRHRRQQRPRAGPRVRQGRRRHRARAHQARRHREGRRRGGGRARARRADPLRRRRASRRTTCCRSTPRRSPTACWAPSMRSRAADRLRRPALDAARARARRARARRDEPEPAGRLRRGTRRAASWGRASTQRAGGPHAEVARARAGRRARAARRST